MAKKTQRKRAKTAPAPQPAPAPVDTMAGPNLGGRPHALEPTPETLDTVRRLGRMWATYDDCAAWFGVTKKTWIAFLQRCPEVVEALDVGKGQGAVSLRKRQFDIAMSPTHKGSPQMCIWLGKQILGQKDQIEATGAGGVPLVPPKITIQYVARKDHQPGPTKPEHSDTSATAPGQPVRH